MKVHENTQYQVLIEDLEECSFNLDDIEALRKKIAHLEEIALAEKDATIKAIITYHKGSEPFHNGDLETCRNYTNKALQMAKEINLTYYILRCYNALAIIDSECADYYASISHYLSAFYIAQAHPEYKYSCVLLNNIGNLFVWLNEHEVAIEYLLQAYDKYYEEGIDKINVISIVVLNIIEEYSILKDYKKVDYWWNKKGPISENVNKSIESILEVNEIQRLYQEGRTDEIYDKVILSLSVIEQRDNFIYPFRNGLRILEYAIDGNDEKVAKHVIACMDVLEKGEEIVTFRRDYVELKYQSYVKFDSDTQDVNAVKTLLDEYVRHASKAFLQMKNTYTRRLVIETRLLEVEHEKADAESRNAKLQKDIELDYFTGILNKVSIEKYINIEIGQRVQEAHHAMLLIDIDHFKDVNDTYGHDRGDELILNVVEMVASTCSKNMLFGRFGGDEFILFVKNIRNDDFIFAFVEELLEKAHRIKVTREKSIELSIGIHFVEEDNFKEAFVKSDEALYKAKRNGRNGYAVS